MAVDSDDWRRFGTDHLRGLTLVLDTWKEPKPEWDHDHCEFCKAKLSDRGDALREGYRSEDSYRWICPTCFEDFRAEYGFRVS